MVSLGLRLGLCWRRDLRRHNLCSLKALEPSQHAGMHDLESARGGASAETVAMAVLEGEMVRKIPAQLQARQ